MRFTIDSDLNYKTEDRDCRPVIFVPDVDLFKLEDDSIIASF